MARILIPIPNTDFDPTEVAVPWRVLHTRGHACVFATPDGKPGHADPRMVTGDGLGLLAPLLRADANGRTAYAELEHDTAFCQPIAYAQIDGHSFDAMLLPGGHAPGMKPYLESELLQTLVAQFFEQHKPVGAICHGVLLAARARNRVGRSILYGRRTTGLTRLMELTAWSLTRTWLGDYYRTYPTTVEDEVTSALAAPADFQRGPASVLRDAPDRPGPGFTVLDGRYLSARWPGDAHRFAMELTGLLEG